jgi:hypothetical protein
MRTTHNRKTTTKVLELFSSKRKELRKVTFLKERDPQFDSKGNIIRGTQFKLDVIHGFFHKWEGDFAIIEDSNGNMHKERYKSISFTK